MRVERAVRVLMTGILCVCIALCGVLTALELTLFREGYLIGKMDRTGYFSSLTAERMEAVPLAFPDLRRS